MQGPLGYHGATSASSGDFLVSPSVLGERSVMFFFHRTKPVQSQAGPPLLLPWPPSHPHLSVGCRRHYPSHLLFSLQVD